MYAPASRFHRAASRHDEPRGAPAGRPAASRPMPSGRFSARSSPAGRGTGSGGARARRPRRGGGTAVPEPIEALERGPPRSSSRPSPRRRERPPRAPARPPRRRRPSTGWKRRIRACSGTLRFSARGGRSSPRPGPMERRGGRRAVGVSARGPGGGKGPSRADPGPAVRRPPGEMRNRGRGNLH